MRIAIGQFNPLVGAFERNTARIGAFATDAAAGGARLLLLPEQALIGYPARDLLLRRDSVAKGMEALDGLVAASSWDDLALVVGFAEPHGGGGVGLYNAAAFISRGSRIAVAHKVLLPNYDVFDEPRTFDPGEELRCVEHDGVRIALTICEDIWSEGGGDIGRRYRRDPMAEAADAGAQLVLNLSASPYWLGKPRVREELLGASARRHGLPIVYCNQVGGQDSLIFDGRSLVVGADGRVLARGRAFEEELLIVDVEPAARGRTRRPATEAIGASRGAADASGGAADVSGAVAPTSAIPAEALSTEDLDDLLAALVLGVRDYVRKTGFERVVLGLSGGIDSALVAAIAVRALGSENVLGVSMPSRYTLPISNEDAAGLAEALGIRLETVSLEPAFGAFQEILEPLFGERKPNLTDENLQARARGVILMALSNELGALLLTTGNKSEIAVGYCTLYGDMAGALAPIGDVPKTVVYALARHLNRERELIPERTIVRPPSAELRLEQTDQDSLPPYETLDRILHAFVEERASAASIVAAGEDEAVVRRVVALVRGAEFKRRQAAPALKVSPRAFGEGWRYPIANGFRD